MIRDLAVESFASLWVPVALIGSLICRTRLRRPAAAATILLALMWLVVAFTPLAGLIAAPLARRDALQPAGAVLVLASRLQRDGEPSTPALSRLIRGLEIIGQGLAPRLVLAELPPPAPSYATLARELMSRLGASGEVLTIGPVRRTRDEALQATALTRARAWHRLIVVTSPTHARRACAAVERAGAQVICSPSLETEFDLETMDRPSERFVCFRHAVHEWLGLFVYQQRGWC